MNYSINYLLNTKMIGLIIEFICCEMLWTRAIEISMNTYRRSEYKNTFPGYFLGERAIWFTPQVIQFMFVEVLQTYGESRSVKGKS